jgi:hypothetical protein
MHIIFYGKEEGAVRVKIDCLTSMKRSNYSLTGYYILEGDNFFPTFLGSFVSSSLGRQNYIHMDKAFVKDKIKVPLQLTISQSCCLDPAGDRKKIYSFY